MKSNIFWRSLSPLIATILLIVVSVILIAIVVTWGSNFTSSSLSSTKDLLVEDVDLTGFIFVRHLSNNIFNIRNASDKEVTFTKYQILSSEELDLTNTDLTFKEPIVLSSGATSSLPIICVPEGSFSISLITDQDKYVNVNINNILGSTNDWCEMTLIGDGSESDPYKIYNVFQLNDVREHYDEGSYFNLEKNIDFDWISLSEFSDISGFEDYDTNGWEPIGYDWSDYFEGNFDGKGNTIKNLYIYRPSQNNIGLFGFVENSEINNLGVVDVNITGKSSVGGIIGRSLENIMSYSFSKGRIIGDASVGGLIGVSGDTEILYSFADIYVSGSFYLGGLIGDAANGPNGVIDNCYSKGVIDASSLTSFYSSGGLVGILAGELYNSYSEVDIIDVINALVFAGGLIGSTTDDMGDIYISNVYSFGAISGTGTLSGLIGEYWDPILVHTINSYWNTETSGQATSAGGEGKTTEEMKQRSTYVGWDFDTVWQIQEGVTYPYLRSNPQSPPPQ